MPTKTVSTDMLGTYHIADHPDLYTPARSNNFLFYPLFPKDYTLLKPGRDGSGEDDYFDVDKAQEVLYLSVDASAVPHPKQNVIELKRGNTVVKFPGAWTYENGSFKFNDFIGAQTKDILIAWKNKSGNILNETVGRVEDVKVPGILVEYTPDHRMIRYFDLKGCWISELNEGDFSSDDDGKREISVTIVYDRAIPHLPDDLE